jgi:hypothetical protein
MNTLRPAVRSLAFFLAFLGAMARGDEAALPGEAQLRATAAKGLAFLDKQADTWMNEKSCNGCHHMPELIWSHREAQRRGFDVDRKMFDEFVDWSGMHAKDTRAGLEMLALMKLAQPDKPAPELTDLIVKAQLPDGSWKPAGQLADMQRRGAPDARANSTRLFLLALGTQPADQPALEAARAKAAPFLVNDEPAKAVDTLLYRALYAGRFGTKDEVASVRAELLKLQHDDGGWAYIIGEEKSDPLATGEALFLLQQAPDAASAGAIGHARAWLVNHQREDGGWDIDFTRISKIDRSKPEKAKSFKAAQDIYTFWGSAWATLGLVESFPIVDAPKSAAP